MESDRIYRRKEWYLLSLSRLTTFPFYVSMPVLNGTSYSYINYWPISLLSLDSHRTFRIQQRGSINAFELILST
jgi:hypothetical protein